MPETWDEAELERQARALGARLALGTVVWLVRELGAGKTTFARGLLRGLGATGEVASPSYGLVHRHPTPRGAAYHVDCYRLHHPDEAQDLDWGAIAADQALIIEWPERAGAWAPPPTVTVRLAHADDPGCRLVEIR